MYNNLTITSPRTDSNLNTSMRELKIARNTITDRDSEGLSKYLTDIARRPLLTAEEEVTLARAIQKGGREGRRAQDKLIEGNLRFVVSVAKQYQGSLLSLGDLISEGNIGLIKAAQHYDETRGFKFISYAVWWIRQAIIEAIGLKSKAVRIPLNANATALKITKVVNQYLQEEGRMPSVDELAEQIHVETEIIKRGLKAMKFTISLDTPLTSDSETSVGDLLTSSDDFQPDTAIDHISLKTEIDQALNQCLTPKQINVVKQSFGIDCEEKSLDEIGLSMHLSRERVRQIRERAIRIIRSNNTINLLRKYMG